MVLKGISSILKDRKYKKELQNLIIETEEKIAKLKTNKDIYKKFKETLNNCEETLAQIQVKITNNNIVHEYQLLKNQIHTSCLQYIAIIEKITQTLNNDPDLKQLLQTIIQLSQQHQEINTLLQEEKEEIINIIKFKPDNIEEEEIIFTILEKELL